MKLDYGWNIKAELEFNNCLTGDLKAEKEAYLRGVQDALESVQNKIEDLESDLDEQKDKYSDLEYDNDSLKGQVELLEEKVSELEVELSGYKFD